MSGIVIVAAKRTPIGSFLGQFNGVPTPQLGATAIKAAMQQSGLSGDDVSELFMGCVLPANLGQAPARQASIKAGLPLSVGATTINKVCGSGMKAIMLAHDLIKAGSGNVMVAGGMESMTNAPHMLNARNGVRFGNAKMVDHMGWDGLTNPYDGKAMGVFGEYCVEEHHFNRKQQDDFAIESVKRARQAQETGAFDDEIAPVTVSKRKGDITYSEDEQPKRSKIDKIPDLKPAFKKDHGTITAASSSSISDGAAALVLMDEDEAKAKGLTPLVRIVAHATHSHEPEWFTTAPVGAMQKVLKQANWQAQDVDLYEINEAFAVVTMTAIKELALDPKKVNIHGGACALGHPIGCSGARIVVTLINAMRQNQARRGVASLCIGGGEATALALEAI